MSASAYDVICLLCGFQTGQLAGSVFTPSKGCLPSDGTPSRRLRCCRCGGSVYLEATEPGPAALLLDVVERARG
jgi:hypothetical protein